MILIRTDTFETNSSSTHSMVLMPEYDFIKWKNGEKWAVMFGRSYLRAFSTPVFIEPIDTYAKLLNFYEQYPKHLTTFKDYIRQNGEQRRDDIVALFSEYLDNLKYLDGLEWFDIGGDYIFKSFDSWVNWQVNYDEAYVYNEDVVKLPETQDKIHIFAKFGHD